MADIRSSSHLSRRTFTAAALASVLPVPTAPAAAATSAAGGTVIVREGRPVFEIVIAQSAQQSVNFAASELALHIGKATGTAPTVRTEDRPAVPGSLVKIVLGSTRSARKAGVAAPDRRESCRIASRKGLLFIVGYDEPGAPLDTKVSAGTLFGVYEVLERYLQVRWLWPGEAGIHVPSCRQLELPPLDEVVSPALRQRNVRTGLKMRSKAHPELGFSAQAAKAFERDQSTFLRRHRMGRGERLSYGHAFTDWWEKDGAAHPEWFQLVGGRRGPTKRGGRYSMCVSNEALQEAIVARWQAGGAGPAVNAVENDYPGSCECERCRALDGPEPADYRAHISPKSKIASAPFVSDRYAAFWRAIQQRASQHDPKAKVVGYAYFNYFVPPTSGVALNDNVYIGFCPSAASFPRSDDEQAWIKAQWSGWARTGAFVFLRANYFLDGYCMPFIFAHQFADEFRHAASERMMGTDLDSLTGHWATQGPTLYLLMRLQADPDRAPDVVLDEYYSSFGPSRGKVKEYFDHWEAYTTSMRDHLETVFEETGASRWRTWAIAAHLVFGEDVMEAGARILAEASQLASGDAEALGRVEFLQLGLEHARLCSRAARRLSTANTQLPAEASPPELQELIAFRKRHEQSWISNFNHCAWIEEQSWVMTSTPGRFEDLDP